MDFLTGLYSNENFGIILFTSVSILVLAFLVILFFGKKDQKERNLAKAQTKNNENMNETNIDSEVAFTTTKSASSVEIPADNTASDSLEKQVETSMKSDNTIENPISLSENLEEDSQDDNEMETEVPVPPKSDFDFDALAASISKELESIGINSENTFVAEPNQFNENFDSTSIDTPYESNPSFESQKENINLYEPPKQTEPTYEVKVESESTQSVAPEQNITMPNPTQFSSVYVSNKTMEENNNESNSTPAMELPKTIELPKLNPEAEQKKEEEAPNMMFPSLENEIPTFEEENRM